MVSTLLRQTNTSPKELAEALGISYISAWRKLNGQRQFRLSELPLLASLLSTKLGRFVSVDELVRAA